MSPHVARLPRNAAAALVLGGLLAACEHGPTSSGANPPPPPASPPAMAISPDGPIILANYVTLAEIDLRAGPSANSPAVGHLTPGTVVQPTGNYSYGWWQVDANRTVGWMGGKDLKLQ